MANSRRGSRGRRASSSRRRRRTGCGTGGRARPPARRAWQARPPPSGRPPTSTRPWCAPSWRPRACSPGATPNSSTTPTRPSAASWRLPRFWRSTDITIREKGIVRVVLRVLRMDKLMAMVQKERDRRSGDDFVHPFPWAHSVVKSVAFEAAIGVLMCINAILIGFQTSADDDDVPLFDIAEHVFTTLFIVEVIFRMLADGWIWIFQLTNFWDVALIIFTSVLPMWILKPIGVQSDAFRLFSVIRVLRMIKLVRMVRMVPLFQILYSLVSGLLGSARLLLFTYVLMGIVLYILAVFSVSWIAKDDTLQDDALAQEYFSTVPAAIFTLLQVLTCDWTSVARPMLEKSPVVVVICVIVIMVVTLVVLNLITAVICNAAIDRRKDDEELEARAKRDMLSIEIKALQDLFLDLDDDQSGALSKDEFMKAAHFNKTVSQKLRLLGVNPGEEEEIWNLLNDGSDEIKVEVFADTMRALQGDAKAKDSFALARRLHRTDLRMEKLTERVQAMLSQAQDLQRQATDVHREVGYMFVGIHEMMASLAFCIPKTTAKREEVEVVSLGKRLGEHATMLW
mmetsp:Transcript_107338/g.334551  ORF Transcript_107338/g.334551 Transcript_107338/m.334551 type:complete len:568 (+) Transcript_107338:108-1811(+)